MVVMQYLLMATLVTLAVYTALVVVANRLSTACSGPLVVRGPTGLPLAGDRLSVATWNLGYAGLGADMDFVADGGTRYLPRSRAVVLGNLRGIVETLGGIDADAFLLQEVARPSPLNLQVDVLDGLRPRFKGFASMFEPEVASRLLPPPLRIAHGTATFSRHCVSGAEKRMLPLEMKRMGGVLKRDYRMLIARLPIADSGREWAIVNVHLAAFDKAGLVRRRQLEDVLEFATQEFAKGNAVIVGGDWNLEFERDRFVHQTEAKHRFWLHDFPLGELPPGWTATFDASVPSVRTVYKPYVAGQNYVTVVDGYVVSPNVEVEEVKGIDQSFLYSDHQPVVARFRLR